MDIDRIVEQLGEAKARAETDPKAPHGIRLNNPGNLRAGATPWNGETGIDERGFCIFADAHFGLRALAKVLLAYHDKYGLCTIRSIVTRWAPPSENDTAAYIAAVSGETTFDADAWLHLGEPSVLAALLRAIVHHENGVQPYDDAEIGAAIEDALA